MSDIYVRRAILDDIETIQRLNYELFQLEKESFDSTLVADWPLSQVGKKYFEDLISNEYVIVAIKNNTIIGYLAGSINEKCSYSLIQYGEINNMFIDDAYRGQGVGKTLVAAFKKYCTDKNIQDLKVVASAKNKKAQEFYKKQGFSDFDVTLTLSID